MYYEVRVIFLGGSGGVKSRVSVVGDEFGGLCLGIGVIGGVTSYFFGLMMNLVDWIRGLGALEG